MKIKRLCAANIREAMRKIREELGPEAVILSNQRTAAGFEIVAAIDYDEQTLQSMRQAPAEAAGRTLSRDVEARSDAEPSSDERAMRRARKNRRSRSHALLLTAGRRSRFGAPAADRAGPDKSRIIWAQDPLLVEMRHEMRIMHNLLEQQLSGLAWGDLARRQPHRADLLSQLLDFGFSPDLCLRLADAAAGESRA